MKKLEKIKTNFNKKIYFFLRNVWCKKHLINSEYKIISLGWNCLSRSIPTEWGLKPRREQGEKSTPFDLSMHDIKYLADIISSHFEDYLEDTVKFNETEWRNEKYNIIYNHDEDCQTKADFDTRYLNRIKNFFDVCANSTPTLFIYNCRDSGSDDINDILKLKETIQNLSKSKKSKFLVITAHKLKPVKGLDVLFLPLPYPNYIWWDENCRYGLRGYNYERRICNKIYNILKTLY